MKRIIFWATVDIFWVMENWVMKKLLGPNGQAKTQFSLYCIIRKRKEKKKSGGGGGEVGGYVVNNRVACVKSPVFT